MNLGQVLLQGLMETYKLLDIVFRLVIVVGILSTASLILSIVAIIKKVKK
jgi:hypothetical protein